MSPPHQSKISFLNWSNEDIFLTSLDNRRPSTDASGLPSSFRGEDF